MLSARAAIAVFSLWAFGGLTQAASIRVLPAAEQLPAIILVEGEFATQDAEKFATAALPLSSAVVVFNSEGGKLLAGIEIGKAARLKGFSTAVFDGYNCLSACALAWLGGVNRFAISAVF